MSPSTDEIPPFQFTLRQLLLLMVFCSIGLALVFHWHMVGIVACFVLGCIALMAIGMARRSQTLFELGGWTLLAGLIGGCLLEPVMSDKDAYCPSKRGQCSNHLKQIGLALHNYHDTYGSFPPAYIADASGRPMHSWRVLILPFMEQKALYDKYNFDEPWDGPNNRKLHTEILHVYCCPSRTDPRPLNETSYVAVVGPQTMWPGAKATCLGDLKDGSPNTLMIVEIANSGIHWMEPRDLHIVQMPMAINPPRGQGISSAHPKVAMAVFADGHTDPLQSSTPPDVLRALLTIAGNETIGDY